jgi:hypothetical protein
MSPTQSLCECLLQLPPLCACLLAPPQCRTSRPHPTHAERRANPDACELYKRKGEAAYKERVLKFALEYPALLEKAKAKK